METSENEDTAYTTSRGFTGYLETVDTKGQPVRVQHSSAAGQSCVWIFCDHSPIEQKLIDEGAEQWIPSPHLDVQGANQVIEALQQFVDANSVVAFLRPTDMKQLHDFYVQHYTLWTVLDKEYGYLGDRIFESADRLKAAIVEDIDCDFAMTKDEFFIWQKLLQFVCTQITLDTSIKPIDFPREVSALLACFANKS